MTSLPKDGFSFAENRGADRPPTERSTPCTKRIILGFLTAVVVFPALAQTVMIEPVGQWPGAPERDAHQIAIKGDHAFVAAGGLHVLDIRHPANLLPVGGFDTERARGVAILGNHACIVDSQKGLLIVDISDPAKPEQVGSLEGLNGAVAVAGNYVFLSSYPWSSGGPSNAGLHIIDITDPANPQETGWFGTYGGYILAFAVMDNFVYAAVNFEDPFTFEWQYSVQIIDVSSPSSPNLVGSYSTTQFASCITVSGDYVYVGLAETQNFVSRVEILNVSDPANPVLAGQYASAHVWDIAVDGTHAFLASEEITGTGVLQVLDISDPANPVHVGQIEGGRFGVTVVDERLYLAGNGFHVVDISDPTDVKPLGEFHFRGARDIGVSGSLALIAQDRDGLHILDLRDPAAPVRVGGYKSSGATRGIATAGNLAYLTEVWSRWEQGQPWQGRLTVLDISDPTNPKALGMYDDDPHLGQAEDSAYAFGHVVVAGKHCYVSAGSAGLQVIDVGEASNPVRVAAYVSGRSTRGIALAGNYVYLTESELSGSFPRQGRLEVLDISDPTSPRRVGGAGLVEAGFGGSIALSANRAFVSSTEGLAGTLSIRIFDLSDPTHPQLLGKYDTRGWSSALSVHGNYVFLGVETSLSDALRAGLEVVDVTQPANPRLVSVWHNSYEVFFPRTVLISGNLIYLGESRRSLHVLRIDGLPEEVRLRAQAAGGSLQLKWPVTATDFALESCGDPTSTTWEPVPGTPQLNGDDYELTVPPDSPARFFRLRKP